MTPKEFAEAIQKVAVDNVKRGLIQMYLKPPGRAPKKRLTNLSEWFNGLSDSDKEKIGTIIHDAAELSAFNILSVIDGALAIESAFEKGSIELWYEKNGTRSRLNKPDGEYLHELMPRNE
jgi:hypothetical protein